jgi:hypothetical protein
MCINFFSRRANAFFINKAEVARDERRANGKDYLCAHFGLRARVRSVTSGVPPPSPPPEELLHSYVLVLFLYILRPASKRRFELASRGHTSS